MIILFQNILLLKDFLAYNDCFGLFTKIKRGSGTSSWCTFSAWFFNKNVFYLILYQQAKLQCHTFFSFIRYQTKCVKFWFSQLMMSQTIRFMLGQHLKQWLTGRKWEDGNTNIWISREWKELFRRNKKHFSWLLKAYHLVKIKNWWKIADTSFKKKYTENLSSNVNETKSTLQVGVLYKKVNIILKMLLMFQPVLSTRV